MLNARADSIFFLFANVATISIRLGGEGQGIIIFVTTYFNYHTAVVYQQYLVNKPSIPYTAR